MYAHIKPPRHLFLFPEFIICAVIMSACPADMQCLKIPPEILNTLKKTFTLYKNDSAHRNPKLVDCGSPDIHLKRYRNYF